MPFPYEKVLIEVYPGGRFNISALDSRGAGHGYRFAGKKFIDAVIAGEDLTRKISHQVNTRDAAEIREYMRVLDRIADPGWPEAVHDLTRALDVWKACGQGVVNFHASREPEYRSKLRTALAAMTAHLDELDDSGERERDNRTARFLPQRTDDQLPAVRVGDVLVFVYWDDDGTLRVTIDTEEVEDRPVEAQVNVNSGTVWEGCVAE